MATLPGFDPSTPNEARILDYLLGGKDNYAVDRDAANRAIEVAPELPMMAQEARKFLGRVVRFLVDTGIDQFVDVACGLMTRGSVHEIAPAARVAYVDNDPVVATHARALLGGSGQHAFLSADMRDTEEMLAELAKLPLLDMERPIGMILHSALPLIPDDDVAEQMVERIREAMVPGSCLVLSHAISDLRPDVTERLSTLYQDEQIVEGKSRRKNLRTKAEVERFFAGLELLEPGLVNLPAWRPDRGEPTVDPASVWAVGGVARKL
ncbi:SAM-dependent methyltransferase [Spirillospora sp. NPDC048911]|uniref:SAM-dependent methyltransferase n=1 Tax=Spirillospora sp. NPDC048911 TaxID=3364527 RepID=UPI003718C5AF